MLKLTEAIKEDWQQVADSGFLTEGHFTRSFEVEVAHLYRGAHAVAVNSAGAALFAVLRVLKPKKVLVPNNTFFATGAMALEAGAQITLVDCGYGDLSMGIEQVENAYDGHDACILTHVGGFLAKDYAAIAAFCRKKKMMLIEDGAHVFGVTNREGLMSGTLGLAAVFSFYPTKAIPVGEGGVIVTKDEKLAEECKRFRNYGKANVGGRIVYSGQGFNLRMDEWTAVVGYHQTRRVTEIIEARTAAAKRLAAVMPPLFVGAWEGNWYKYPVSSSFPATKQSGKVYQLSDQLRSIWPLNEKVERFLRYPNSDWVAANHICLPLDEDMYKDMDATAIYKFLTGDQP